MNQTLTGILTALVLSAVAGSAFGQSSSKNWVPIQNDGTNWSGGAGTLNQAGGEIGVWTGGFDHANRPSGTDWTSGFDTARRQEACSQNRAILEKAESYWNQVAPQYRRQYGSQFNASVQNFKRWCAAKENLFDHARRIQENTRIRNEEKAKSGHLLDNIGKGPWIPDSWERVREGAVIGGKG